MEESIILYIDPEMTPKQQLNLGRTTAYYFYHLQGYNYENAGWFQRAPRSWVKEQLEEWNSKCDPELTEEAIEDCLDNPMEIIRGEDNLS